MKPREPRILFVCTGNAGRSQIARALCETIVAQTDRRIYARSAGVEPWDHLHPMAVKLLAERGIDISQRKPRAATAALGEIYDLVVTIGDPARQKLPRPMPGDPRIVHWDISDPADADGKPDSEAVFRRTLQAIESRLPALVEDIARQTARSRVLGRPGIGTGVWHPGRFEPAVHLPQAVAAGFAAIELNLFLGVKHFDYHDPQCVRELKRVAEDLGVEIWSIHEPRNIGALGSVDSEARHSAADDLKQSIDLAAELGASAIPTHALLHQIYSDSTVGHWSIAVEELLKLAPMIRAAGTRVAVENGYRDANVTLEHFAQLRDEAFGFVIDTGHANMAGADAFGAIFAAAKGRMISLHLNDNGGQKDDHLPPGANGATVNWSQVAGGLAEIGYDGCILWEVFSALGGRNDDPMEVMRRTMEMSRLHFSREIGARV